MTLLIASLTASVLAVIFTVVWIVLKRHRKDGEELVVVAEIPETGAFGAVLAALGFVMLIAKLSGVAVGGTEASSEPFTAAFGIILVLAGCDILLQSLVKRTIAYKDRLAAYNLFGGLKAIPWGSVTAVKTSLLSRRATFESGECSISVNGRREDYLKLVKIAKEKVPAIVSSDDLGKLLRRLSR